MSDLPDVPLAGLLEVLPKELRHLVSEYVGVDLMDHKVKYMNVMKHLRRMNQNGLYANMESYLSLKHIFGRTCKVCQLNWLTTIKCEGCGRYVCQRCYHWFHHSGIDQIKDNTCQRSNHERQERQERQLRNIPEGN